MQNKLCNFLSTLVTIFLAASASAQTTDGSRPTTPTARIINGHATNTEWPWMAFLFYPIRGPVLGQFCGASLISPTVAITAAHCADTFKAFPDDVRVAIGKNRLSDSLGSIAKISGVVVHPHWNASTMENDLALIYLEAPVSASPLPLISPTESTLWQAGSSATILGWGTMDPDTTVPAYPDLLQEGTIDIFSDANCEGRYGIGFYPASQFCAGKLATNSVSGDGVDTCYGDSGGPIIVQDGNGGFRLIGLTSWGYGCGTSRYPGVYTRLSPFVPWINSNPPAQAFWTTTPTVKGLPSPGQTVTCDTGVVKGIAPITFTFQWIQTIDFSSYEITGATDQTYVVQPGDIGATLSCVVHVTNPGGTASLFSDDVLVENLATPTPTPTPVATPSDTSAPSVRLLGTRCERKSCTASLQVEDNSGADQVASVSASVIKKTRSTCRVKGSSHPSACVKTSTVSVNATSVTLPIWEIKFPKAKKAASLSVRVQATDMTGNVLKNPTKFTVQVPSLSRH